MKRTQARTTATPQDDSASEAIGEKIAALGDWRGETLGRLRALIKEADPDVVEELKWRGTPVWSHSGILCTGETYKRVVKMTFAKGAYLKDPSRLFNSSLEGNLRRAIDVHEGEKLDAAALQALIREAVALNVAGKKPAPGNKPALAKKKPALAKKKAAPVEKPAPARAKKKPVPAKRKAS